jgi:prepilin-type N-terminal cleavage/methylation domain-containing protein
MHKRGRSDASAPFAYDIIVRMKQKNDPGFTLVELIVAISLVGILATVVYTNVFSTSGTGRDAKRQADVLSLQVAIEKYRTKNGRYPAAGCVTPGNFSSESTCPDYIPGLAPEFINRLPRDSRRQNRPGYTYITNANGTVYKVMAAGTVETTVTSSHPLQSCSATYCTATCTSNAAFQRSYGAWGGIELVSPANIYNPDPLAGLSAAQRQTALAPTTNIICRQPTI